MASPDLDRIISKVGQVKRMAREHPASEAVARLAEAVEDLASVVKELKKTVDLPKRQV